MPRPGAVRAGGRRTAYRDFFLGSWVTLAPALVKWSDTAAPAHCRAERTACRDATGPLYSDECHPRARSPTRAALQVAPTPTARYPSGSSVVTERANERRFASPGKSVPQHAFQLLKLTHPSVLSEAPPLNPKFSTNLAPNPSRACTLSEFKRILSQLTERKHTLIMYTSLRLAPVLLSLAALAISAGCKNDTQPRRPTAPPQQAPPTAPQLNRRLPPLRPPRLPVT